MTASRIGAAAIAVWTVAMAWPAAQAQAATYIPPGSARPLFGGEFELSQVGPVAGYWPTECQTWRRRAEAHRAAPLAPPRLNRAFQRMISGLIAEHPNYDDMSPAMAQAVRSNLGAYWPSLNRMGDATAAKRIDKDDRGNDIYVIDQKGGATHWNIAVGPGGKIEAAFLCRGTGI
jgi:hypothetical protein